MTILDLIGSRWALRGDPGNVIEVVSHRRHVVVVKSEFAVRRLNLDGLVSRYRRIGCVHEELSAAIDLIKQSP